MKQQVIILNGITYDYCEETRFYRMIGLLDSKTGIFEGVEVVTNNFETLEKTKERIRLLDPISARMATGFVDETIHYSVLDMQKGIATETELKKFGDDSFYGHEQQEEILTRRINSNFKTGSSIETVEDLEMKVLLDGLLSCQQRNFIFSKLQANVVASKEVEKVKIYSA